MKAQTLQLPGATLYYETRGSGLVLLLIAGRSSDAGVFEGVANFLAHDYTGDHSGYVTQPAAFAAKLRDVLGGGQKESIRSAVSKKGADNGSDTQAL